MLVIVLMLRNLRGMGLGKECEVGKLGMAMMKPFFRISSHYPYQRQPGPKHPTFSTYYPKHLFSPPQHLMRVGKLSRSSLRAVQREVEGVRNVPRAFRGVLLRLF